MTNSSFSEIRSFSNPSPAYEVRGDLPCAVGSEMIVIDSEADLRLGAAIVVVLVSLALVRASIKEVHVREEFYTKTRLRLVPSHLMTNIVASATYLLATVLWFDLQDLQLFAAVACLSSLFMPHLCMKSPFARAVVKPGIALRSWFDPLVVTSGFYASSSVAAVFCGQYNIALLCAVTATASGLYHRNRESKFFNLDMIFASSLLVLYGYSLWHSLGRNELYVLIGCIGLPVCGFLFVYCGLPCEVHPFTLGTDVKTGLGLMCCTRDDIPHYNFYHTLWHLASGVGPLLAVWYFESIRAAGIVDENVYYLPFYGLVTGVVLNIFGSVAGKFPVD